MKSSQFTVHSSQKTAPTVCLLTTVHCPLSTVHFSLTIFREMKGNRDLGGVPM